MDIKQRIALRRELIPETRVFVVTLTPKGQVSVDELDENNHMIRGAAFGSHTDEARAITAAIRRV